MASGIMEQLEQLERQWGLTEDECDEARRRLQREAERMKLAERDAVLRAWLPVVDNMERALGSDWDARDPLREGVQAIHRQMLQILDEFEVRREPSTDVDPGDLVFDPHLHQAVATVDGEDTGAIAEVMEPGYLIEDRVLRAAKVTTVRSQGTTSGS